MVSHVEEIAKEKNYLKYVNSLIATEDENERLQMINQNPIIQNLYFWLYIDWLIELVQQQWAELAQLAMAKGLSNISPDQQNLLKKYSQQLKRLKDIKNTRSSDQQSTKITTSSRQSKLPPQANEKLMITEQQIYNTLPSQSTALKNQPSAHVVISQQPKIQRSIQFRMCGVCAGTGYQTCSSCGGSGYHTYSRTRTRWDNSTEYYQESIPCSCSGGRVTCYSCGGTGRKPA